jgi:hypothetical protein
LAFVTLWDGMAFKLGELANAPEPLGAALRACKRHFQSAFFFRLFGFFSG